MSSEGNPQTATGQQQQTQSSTVNQQVATPNRQEEKKAKKRKEEKKKGDDYLLLVYPEMAKSFRAKVQNCVMEILKKNLIMNEKDLVLQLIFDCEAAKEYYKVTHETQYLRRIIWKMAKDKIILRAKIVGDERYTWYLLPENLEKVKDRVLRRG